MAENASNQWYLYHRVGTKLVMDRADSNQHLEQHHADKGLPKPDYICASLEPLSDKTVKAYEDQYALTHDKTARPHLAPWKPPESPDAAKK
jgi:hypothetical protein